MLKRLVLLVVGGLAAWLWVLVILAYALGSRQERHTKERLAESLHAAVTIHDTDLALIRGRFSIDQLAVRRDDTVGHLTIDVAEVRCELGPLGWALFDRDCRELAVRGTRLEVSTAALFKFEHPKRKPIHAERLVIDDAVLVFLPTAIMPSLGRVEITIEHAESGPTTLRTPLSWLFSLRELRAKLDLPARVNVQLTYREGVLTVASSWLGSAPVELPVQLPVASTAHDAHEEMQLLVKLGKDIAEQLVAQRAEDWVKSQLKPQ